jgi:hypothetical protein
MMIEPLPIEPLPHQEYLRRNLVHCGSIGVHAGISNAIDRLKAQKRPPQWLVKQLESMLPRAAHSASELAMWRDSAPDRPDAGSANVWRETQVKSIRIVDGD